MGDGKRITFWEDNWCGEGTSKEIFSNLYNLAKSKGSFIAEVWDSSTGEGAWNPSFGRNLNGWEIEEAQNFLNIINLRRVNQRDEDRLC